MKYIVVTGRIFFSLIFLNAITFHFTKGAVDYAASNNVPAPEFFVPFSGIIALIGGLSIALGYKAKIGAWLIVLFLVPVTFMMHAFWLETEPMQTQMQLTSFLKNISMLGGAFLITYFGAGPLSLDNRQFVMDNLNEEALNNILIHKGVQLEDTKDKIKVVAYEQVIEELEFQHFSQNPDNPGEVVFVFRANNLKLAKHYIKKTFSGGKRNHSQLNVENETAELPELIFLNKNTI